MLLLVDRLELSSTWWTLNRPLSTIDNFHFRLGFNHQLIIAPFVARAKVDSACTCVSHLEVLINCRNFI